MSSLPPDPYKILGVSKDAQIVEIRSAHRKLVLKCHPDKVQDPTLKAQKQDEFQKVQQAYELLSDEKERQKYDDQVKLVELRRQMSNRANTAAPRSSSKYTEYEIRTPEPRSSSFKSAASSPTTSSRVYATYSKSWDEEGRGTRFFETEPRSRREREGSYSEKPSKRDIERERERDVRDREREREREREYREREKEREKEREREYREREKEKDRQREREREMREREKEQKERDREARDRERRKTAKAEEATRREKEAKEARRAEKKRTEKTRDQQIKRETEEKKRHAKPYIEEFDDVVHPSKSEKKKSSSSKKHDEKRERSSHREEVIPDPIQAMPIPSMPTMSSYDPNLDFAQSYIELSRAKAPGGVQRSATYHGLKQPPAVPTPPPVAGQASMFPAPDEEEVRRSSARARRGSSDTVASSRSKSHKKSSREALGDPVVVDASPLSRHAPGFSKSSTTTPVMSSSPPRQELPRTNTMPIDTAYPRPSGGISRAATFSYGDGVSPRGRSRSKFQPQIEEEYESEEDYDRRHKHRSSKKNQESVHRYHVESGRTKAYTRQMEAEPEQYYYTTGTPGVRVMETSRPSLSRETSYTAKPFKVKYSKNYGEEDIHTSSYYPATTAYREDYSSVYA